MSVPRGRGLGSSPMEEMFVEMDRGGAGVLTHVKDNHVRIVNTQICLCIYTG